MLVWQNHDTWLDFFLSYESVALTLYYWNWTMFAQLIYKKEMGTSKRTIVLVVKGTLMQIWKSPYVCVQITTIP